MTYHLKNWEYFIEMSCFIPGQMIELLSDTLKSSKIFSAEIECHMNKADKMY